MKTHDKVQGRLKREAWGRSKRDRDEDCDSTVTTALSKAQAMFLKP